MEKEIIELLESMQQENQELRKEFRKFKTVVDLELYNLIKEIKVLKEIFLNKLNN